MGNGRNWKGRGKKKFKIRKCIGFLKEGVREGFIDLGMLDGEKERIGEKRRHIKESYGSYHLVRVSLETKKKIVVATPSPPPIRLIFAINNF